ncbi:hypothetical protein [Kitasatospora camelliae]|uniref:Uncharacterized protein n=1 Tax=Kitasatospora camelliae TaxID=3156397 RepID=A0AAU8K714_9ACTN
MSFDLAFAGADQVPTRPEDRVAAGSWLPCPDALPHQTLVGSPISYVSVSLWQALGRMAAELDPVAARQDPTSVGCDVLRLITMAAVDTALAPGAEPGEPRDDLYMTPSVVQLGRRPVWFKRFGPDGTLTALFPEDM